MVGIAMGIGIFALAFTYFILLGRVRDRAMMSLASELGFEYLNRSVPTTFPRQDDRFSQISSIWNVIHGHQKGMEIVIFDGISGDGRGVYHTFIAVRAPSDPFPRDEGFLGNTLQSSGWTVLFEGQKALNLIPWSISTTRIKGYLRSLRL